MRPRCLELLTFTLVAGAALGLAAAQPVGDKARGQTFAEEVCADCHAVDPVPRVLTTDPPRSFVEIAGDAKTTEMSLRVFLRTPHDQMPDFILTREQTDDVIAYLLSLKP